MSPRQSQACAGPFLLKNEIRYVCSCRGILQDIPATCSIALRSFEPGILEVDRAGKDLLQNAAVSAD